MGKISDQLKKFQREVDAIAASDDALQVLSRMLDGIAGSKEMIIMMKRQVISDAIDKLNSSTAH